MSRLIVATKHLLAMIPNGVDFQRPIVAAREACIRRRLRFTHHALTFRFGWARTRLRLGDDFEIPGGNASFQPLVPYSRALQFQQGAVPAAVDVREEEWSRFHDIVDDQLNVRYPIDYLLDATRRDPVELLRATWIRSLLEPIMIILPVIRRHRSAVTKAFSLSDSATLCTPMN